MSYYLTFFVLIKFIIAYYQDISIVVTLEVFAIIYQIRTSLISIKWNTYSFEINKNRLITNI